MVDAQQIGHHRAYRFEQAVALTGAVAGVALLAWAGSLLGRGLDFSDDGYYLNLNRAPELYSFSVTQFGFVYRPLFDLVGWDVALFRQAGLAITILLSGALVLLLAIRAGLTRLNGLVGVVIVAPVCLTLYYMWLPTPGYNSLGFQGLLIVGIALVLLERSGRGAIAAWIVLGVGGWVVFMAKPTSAAALGPLVLFYLIVARRLGLRGLVVASITAAVLLLSSVLFIDGSVGAFVRRLETGARFAAMLQGGHTLAGILRLDRVTLSIVEWSVLVANTAIIGAATCCARSGRSGLRGIGAAIAAVYVLAAIGVAAGFIIPPFGFKTFIVLQVCAAPLGAILGAVLSGWRSSFGWSNLWLACLFALFPHVLSFGTNNNLWANGAMASLFWVLAGFVVASGNIAGKWRAGLPAAAGVLGTVAIIIAGATQQPYRQTAPLQSQDDIVLVGPGQRPLPMSTDFAAYLRKLRDLAAHAGFTAGTPIIDLTGHYPGALFAIDAKAVGQAWMIGGYRGSDELGREALKLVSCELIAAAWLFEEPTGQRALAFDAMLPRTLMFEEVGRLTSPTGTYPNSYEQRLLRPVGDLGARRELCEASRR